MRNSDKGKNLECQCEHYKTIMDLNVLIINMIIAQ